MITITKLSNCVDVYDGLIHMISSAEQMKRGWKVVLPGMASFFDYLTAPITDFVINDVTITNMSEFTTQLALSIPVDSGGGGTGTLQEVTTNGNTTNQNIEVNRDGGHVSVADANGENYAKLESDGGNGGRVQLNYGDFRTNIKLILPSADHEFNLPDEDGTAATQEWSLSLPQNREIEINNHNFTIKNGNSHFQDILASIFQHFIYAGDGTNQAGLQLVGDSNGDTLCYLNAGNGVDYVFITLDFITNTIKYDAGEHQFEGDTSITGKAAIGGGAAGVGTSNLKISGLQSFADNAAAILGGLTTGDVYYTDAGSGNLHLMICNNPD